MNKFKNKYRIPSARLQNWDYGSPGLYFITICTKNRECYFGKIKNSEMLLNELGLIANDEWIKTPQIRPDMNLELGEFIVMPNHFHAIIIIGENNFNSLNSRNATDIGAMPGTDALNRRDGIGDRGVTNDRDVPDDEHPAIRRDAMHGVSTTDNITSNKFGPQSKNLGSVIRGYKSSVTTHARKNNIEFDWQERFHDHIIRSHDDFGRISNYIINNAANWQQDKFFK
ncbi:MAG: transposase [Chitinophagales bacterium]